MKKHQQEKPMAVYIIRLFLGLILIMTIVFGHPVTGKSAESIFGFTFKDIQSPLSVLDKSSRTGKEALPQGDLLMITPSAFDYTEKSIDSSWNEIEYKHFRLSFNSMLAEPSMDIDKYYRRLTPGNSLEAGQMVPLIFQGSYRDSLQSFGKLVEPQIRIEIRF
jgi:hypothetical protein